MESTTTKTGIFIRAIADVRLTLPVPGAIILEEVTKLFTHGLMHGSAAVGVDDPCVFLPLSYASTLF